MPAWTAPAARSNWNDELLASVCEAVRPHRPDGYGAARATLVANHDQLKTWVVTDGLTEVEAHELLGRLGVVVPERTLHRYALGGPRRGPLGRTTTVPEVEASACRRSIGTSFQSTNGNVS